MMLLQAVKLQFLLLVVILFMEELRFQKYVHICVVSVKILGCADSSACNYNVFANQDNDSCVYAQELDPWCNDTDGSLGAGEEVYSCSTIFR